MIVPWVIWVWSGFGFVGACWVFHFVDDSTPMDWRHHLIVLLGGPLVWAMVALSNVISCVWWIIGRLKAARITDWLRKVLN